MWWALGLFLVAALTDWLDGYVARKRRQVTALGRILDPFVDKVLICGTFLVFSSSGFVNPGGTNITGIRAWMVVLIIGSELLVSGLASFCESHGRGLSVTRLGKIKMFTQVTCTGWVLLFLAGGQSIESDTVQARITAALIWVTVVITATSSLNYLYLARRMLARAGLSD